MRALLAIVVAGALTSQAQASVEMTCGASSGYSYYPADGGWVEDGISGGGFLLLRDGNEYDIVYTDIAGSLSAKGDGATVLGYESDFGPVVLVVYPAVFETYQFNRAASIVMWTQNKFHPALPRKLAAFVAPCED